MSLRCQQCSFYWAIFHLWHLLPFILSGHPKKLLFTCTVENIISISIYTLSDLGDLSNLIGSLSRTNQQYSPPTEWIMWELSFFPIFLGKYLLKVDKILGLTFFQARKDFERFIYCCWVLWSMDCLQLPFIRLEEAVSWTQRFLTRKIWPKKSTFIYDKQIWKQMFAEILRFK